MTAAYVAPYLEKPRRELADALAQRRPVSVPITSAGAGQPRGDGRAQDAAAPVRDPRCPAMEK